jgi:hypothetical protein
MNAASLPRADRKKIRKKRDRLPDHPARAGAALV